MKLVKMKPEVLIGDGILSGITCPICGKTKSPRAFSCRTCYKARNGQDKAKLSVSAVLASIVEANEAHQKSQSGDVARERIFNPVLAQMKIHKGAKFIRPGHFQVGYLKQVYAFHDCVIEGFIFSATEDDRGKTITVLIELKTKVKNQITYPYIRAQKVHGATSPVKFAIKNHDEDHCFCRALPHYSKEYNIKNSILKFSVGFVYAN